MPFINKGSVPSLSCGVSFHSNKVNLLWHYRLSHVPFAKMRGMSILVTFSPRQPFFCSICPMARKIRLSFPDKTTTTNTIFELVHVDLWGPYHVATYDGYKYFITLVDDYSRVTWTHLLSCKSNILQIIRIFVTMVQN